ncbi:hypothetical protein FNV43_RR19907 [Rhamnella rubrinervis]|uniref:Uncharacterized protein n=1 Tax=Rhamnella rubrinervis TaxID=2594499 RepID=A0A8K0GSV7_9ROSA|nr:hypothetical protein FNV43_RR19907 [Rhamnella rubrinervis]
MSLQLTNSVLLIFSLFAVSLYAHPFFHFLSQDDLNDNPSTFLDDSSSDDSVEWDGFRYPDSHKSDSELDPGSWRSILEPDSSAADPSSEADALYFSAVSKMFNAVNSGEVRLMNEATSELEAVTAVGHPHSQSLLGFLHGVGLMRERNKAKAFMYHYFAAEDGNTESKMALAYTYFKQEMFEKAVEIYSELAELAVSSFLISRNSPVIEPVRIHNGAEENDGVLWRFRGEEDDDFKILEYQAKKGAAGAMYKLGLFYYFGLRGLRRDNNKALSWFVKAVEEGEPRSMELLGEMYARGDGVERNYTKALEWLTLASEKLVCSAYNGLGYLYVKGYGVEKNYSKAMEYFEKAAENEEAGGQYSLGLMYLKGIWVKKDVKLATEYFIGAANAGHSKGFYQLAKMFHTGVGLKKNIVMATALYKLVAEKGPWSSLSRWALESYMKGNVGKALFLYSRMAELGYEVAQSNAAWILDKYGKQSMCIGESGFCTDTERHERAYSLWRLASKQGNDYADLQIGQGTERDYDRGADAYMNATKVGDVCSCESMSNVEQNEFMYF